MRAALRQVREVPDVANDELPDLDAVKHAHVVHVLEICRGNRTIAARILQVDRKTLYRKLAEWGVAPPRGSRSQPREHHAEE